jgi:1-acyl-sn-glycerol-3-phosphate acyltransferase
VNLFLRWAKLAWLLLWLVGATLAVSGPIAAAALLSPTGNFPFRFSQAWAWVVLAAAGVRLKSAGTEKIEKGRSYIVIANHQSHFDAPAIVLALGIQFRWVAKKELLKIPVFGHALYACRAIFVDRSNQRQAIRSLRKGLRRLAPGASVLFFAEGSRSPDGRIGSFKKGGFFAAVDAGFPILPVTVNGSRRILPKGSLDVRSGTIQVVVGDPIDPAPYTLKTIDALMTRTREAIIANYRPGRFEP